MKHNFLDDVNGNKSSKRLWGSIILGGGIVLAIVLFTVSLFKEAVDPATAIKIINLCVITGAGLLGIGVFERGKKRHD